MKKVYRSELNEDYWDRRWSDAEADAENFGNLNIYPIKYADFVTKKLSGSIVELGCGLGRVVRHYHNLGRDITGVERSSVAVEKLRAIDSTLKVTVGDVTALEFEGEIFDIALAFGLFHNLESDMKLGLAELRRVLKNDGCFVISMRPNNFEMHANEWYWQRKWKKKKVRAEKKFHKWLVAEDEFKDLLGEIGLRVDNVYYAKNMSILYRLPFFRDKNSSSQKESDKRSGGTVSIWSDVQLIVF